MEEKKLTEKESLELITQMICQTRQRIERGSGNAFLLAGYVCIMVACAVYTLLVCTGDTRAYLLWGLVLPVMAVGALFRKKRKQPRESYVKTGIDQMIQLLWTVVGWLFVAQMLLCLLFEWSGHTCWVVMGLLALPLSSLGTAVTGIIVQERVLQVCGILGFVVGVLYLCLYVSGISLAGSLMLGYALCYGVIMVVPGHVLNYKASSKC